MKSGKQPLYSLKNKNFLILWLGMFASINAMEMAGIAGGWLVYTMTGSSLALGVVMAAGGIPLILFSLFGGAVADRVKKRNLLFITQSSLCAVAMVITGLVAFKIILLWHLIVTSIFSGLVNAFNMPARQAILLEVVNEDELTNAIALNSTAGNICRIGSPALAGVLLSVIGIPGVYGIVALCYGLAAFSLVMLPEGEKRSKKSDRKVAGAVMEDVMEGLKFVRSNPTLFSLLLLAFVPLITAVHYFSLMPVFAKTIFKAGEKGLGFLMSSAGIGALCGSFLIAVLGNFRQKGLLMLWSGMMFGLSLVCFAQAGSLIPAMVFLVIVGAGGSMFLTLIMSLIMSNTPQDLVGRVMSIFIMTWGLMPLSALPAGGLAQIFGAPLIVSVGGVILFLFLTVMSVMQPQLRKLQ